MLTRLGGTRHITMPNFLKTGLSAMQNYCDFSILFLANGVQRIKTHEFVKFWQNRSIGYEDAKIFQFFKVADATILNFQICEISLADRVWKAQNHQRAKCRQIRSYCCGYIAIFRIFKMAVAAMDFLK